MYFENLYGVPVPEGNPSRVYIVDPTRDDISGIAARQALAVYEFELNKLGLASPTKDARVLDPRGNADASEPARAAMAAYARMLVMLAPTDYQVVDEAAAIQAHILAETAHAENFRVIHAIMEG